MPDDALWTVAERIKELTDKVAELTDMLRGKLGGWDTDNLNVTLYTDNPIMTTDKKGDK